MQRRERTTPQMFVFCYHKVGTVLFLNVAAKLAARFGLTATPAVGMVREIDRAADIVIFPHSLLDLDLDDYDYRGIHLVRDPRDVWVSGYFYHGRCTEPWCINADFDPSPPIDFPRVPYSQRHRPEAWKRSYLAGLGGRSYQQNLRALDPRAGMRFELERYTAWTLEAMAAWAPQPGRILELQFEAFARDFDGAMTAALSWLGFPEAALPQALAIAATEDVARMDDRTVAGNPHIHSRKLSKWGDVLSADDLREFEPRYGELIARLGYRA
ncbi:MAG: hypothetical protein GZ089_07040 [Aromatoleum sp.]|nr:hypothetical protein [Aromatoleum sp.]